MSQVVGMDVGHYIFDPVTRQIIIFDVPQLSSSAILLITNVTAGVVIYQFNSVTKGGTLTNQTLLLDYDTTTMASTDVLQIVVAGNPVVDRLDTLIELQTRMIDLLSTPKENGNGNL